MAELLVSFSPGWVHSKDALPLSGSLFEIVNFYVWGLPCEGVSSSARTMSKRGWSKDVWKAAQLRTYLLTVANLRNNVTLKKTEKIDMMTDAVTTVGLGSKTFHTMNDCNRIAFYSDGRRPDILTILYYIRCAFAHGRFEIHTKPNSSSVYVLEAVHKKKGTFDYSVRARMIISEETLITWKNTILEGESTFKSKVEKLSGIVRNEIIKLISGNVLLKKKADIAIALPFEESLVYTELKRLKDEGIVEYSQKQWKLVGGDSI